MKSCPTCNRTYADDTFTFCLNDGALLSAPYDPQAPKYIQYPRTDPPPTEVMPHHALPTGSDLSPTLPATPPMVNYTPQIEAAGRTETEDVPGMSGAMTATIIILVILSIVIAVVLSRC